MRRKTDFEFLSHTKIISSQYVLIPVLYQSRPRFSTNLDIKISFFSPNRLLHDSDSVCCTACSVNQPRTGSISSSNEELSPLKEPWKTGRQAGRRALSMHYAWRPDRQIVFKCAEAAAAAFYAPAPKVDISCGSICLNLLHTINHSLKHTVRAWFFLQNRAVPMRKFIHGDLFSSY